MESISSQKSDLVRALKEELILNILPFWSNKMIDNEHGGFIGKIDGRDIRHHDSPKGGVLNARILWTFSSAFIFSKEPRYLLLAQRAFDYLVDQFIDKEKGGIYWMLDHLGNPLNSKKQIYAQAFAIYGLSEFYRASGQLKALEEAIALYKHIENHSFDKTNNGYFEAYDRNWNLLDDLRLSEKDANEKKTMNTHLHILEAYTTLFLIWPDLQLKKQLANLVELFLDKFINDEHHYNLFFDENWILKSDVVSYGHDIEGTWLVYEAAKVLQDKNLIKRATDTAIKMVDKTIKVAIDKDGGLMYEGSPEKAEDTDKHWWPQAEAMVGFVNAWQLTAEVKYLEMAIGTWEFIRKHVIDKRNGEWFSQVDRSGNPYYEEDKAGFWKCPYHNGRACLEIIRRLNP